MLRVMHRYFLLAIFTFMLAGISVFLVINWHLDSPMQVGEDEFVFTVPSGSSLTLLSLSLAEKGMLKWPEVLIVWSRVTGQSTIKAGEYKLQPVS